MDSWKEFERNQQATKQKWNWNKFKWCDMKKKKKGKSRWRGKETNEREEKETKRNKGREGEKGYASVCVTAWFYYSCYDCWWGRGHSDLYFQMQKQSRQRKKVQQTVLMVWGVFWYILVCPTLFLAERITMMNGKKKQRRLFSINKGFSGGSGRWEHRSFNWSLIWINRKQDSMLDIFNARSKKHDSW